MQHMAGSTVSLDTSLLPANLTSLQDAEFYHFVKRIFGPVEAELLQVQQINNVNSLLMSAGVFEIIQIPSQDLDDIKRKICFEKDDGSFVIETGVKGNIDSNECSTIANSCMDSHRSRKVYNGFYTALV